ncbi:hypothetical protein [Streptomyces sp. NBC_00118]|uniref:hypothetical protein n=1 Tax=Streptomyces sp. NBC_00118 TaxID=2975658 RepID=UPI003248372E
MLSEIDLFSKANRVMGIHLCGVIAYLAQKEFHSVPIARIAGAGRVSEEGEELRVPRREMGYVVDDEVDKGRRLPSDPMRPHHQASQVPLSASYLGVSRETSLFALLRGARP